jgi:hypothetical protein
MNTSFISASLANMEPRLVRACALWAALRVCEHETPRVQIVAGVELAVASLLAASTASEQSMWAAMQDDCPSAARSAIFALNDNPNFRIHAHHALVELAKQQGLHFVEAMLNDTFESGSSPLEEAA